MIPNFKHGLCSHPLYSVWKGIKYRCYNPTCKDYVNYGGRGIKVCGMWVYHPKNFIDWAEDNGWALNLQIDRRDNDKGYSPSNCRFVSAAVNTFNRGKPKSNKSGHKNIRKTVYGTWIIKIKLNKKLIFNRTVKTLSSAIYLRDKVLGRYRK